MISRVALIAIALALAVVSSAALAQDSGKDSAQDSDRPRGACREDVQKLCAGIERGGGRIRDCLASQKDKLSDDCRKRVESRESRNK